MKNLLISVLGNSSSGKSTTWYKLLGEDVRTGKYERELYLPKRGFEKVNTEEYVDVFLINGSPQETRKAIDEIAPDEPPRIVLCSIQHREDAREIYEYFIERDYFLFVHWLNPGNLDGGNYPYYDNCGLMDWLLFKHSIVGIRDGTVDASDRAREIKEYIYGWAWSRNLIEKDS